MWIERSDRVQGRQRRLQFPNPSFPRIRSPAMPVRAQMDILLKFMAIPLNYTRPP
jgi:hypothetical protein